MAWSIPIPRHRQYFPAGFHHPDNGRRNEFSKPQYVSWMWDDHPMRRFLLCLAIIFGAVALGNTEAIAAPLNINFSSFKNYLISSSQYRNMPLTKEISVYKLTTEKVFNKEAIAKQKEKIEVIGPLLRIGSNYPDNFFLSQNAVGLPPSSLVGTSPSPFAVLVSMTITDPRGRFAFSFKGTGGKISINYKKGSGSKYRIAKLVEPPVDGSLNTNIVEFGSSGKFVVEFQCDSNISFGGVSFLDKKSTLDKPVGKQKPRVAFAGDSFSEPTISDLDDSYSWQGFPQVFASMTNTNVQSVASGGTGYLKQYNNRIDGLSRIKKEVVPQKFDVVVIALGINDLAYFKSSELSAALVDVLNSFKLESPKSLVYVVSPFWPKGSTFAPESLLESNHLLDLACKEYERCAFIDLWKDGGYIQGSGTSLEPHGDGNADWITGPDGTHPTILGHQYIARLILQKILELN